MINSYRNWVHQCNLFEEPYRLRQISQKRARSQNYDASSRQAVEHQARTRHLLELGGLIQKAGLVDLTEDDRTTLLGAMLALSDMLSGEVGAAQREVWRRRGKRAFDLESANRQGRMRDPFDVAWLTWLQRRLDCAECD